MDVLALLVIAIACLLAGGTAPKPWNRKSKGPTCPTALIEYEAYCGVGILKYFYNRTSKRCEHFRWNGCLHDGVYDTRIDCANHCNPDEDASICEKSRANTCEASSSTQAIKDQYFYNITNGTCEKYTICSGVGEFMTENSFNSKTLCIMQCGGFSLDHTRSGRSDGRQLLGMLDTTEKIWIYKRNSNGSFLDTEHSCIKYEKYQLNRSKHGSISNYDYDYNFFYEWVVHGRTYQTRYSAQLGYDNKTGLEHMVIYTGKGSVLKELVYWSHRKKCGIMTAKLKNEVWCELHVWEDRLRESYKQSGNYTGCQEELSKYCANNTEHETVRPDCPNVFFVRGGRYGGK
ncbi:uncharacterized protein LOC142586840 isoform X2 [Dermacentor variabilis]|uniref:uncharacterized protein LOC142586840 isoform X2 n=1 Tax=Dermacentor variabilis TaxID=34621 RepID=UPI003F5B7479